MKNRTRNEEIIRRRKAGEWPSDIYRAMGLSRNVVIGVLNRAGMCSPDTDRGEACAKYAARGSARPNAILHERTVTEIRERFKKSSRIDGARSIARDLGINYRTVLWAATGRSWTHVEEAA